MPDKHPKRRRDLSQWAKHMVDIATGLATEPGVDAPVKNGAAVERSGYGGLKGGKARSAKMTPERRAEIARKAAQSRRGK